MTMINDYEFTKAYLLYCISENLSLPISSNFISSAISGHVMSHITMSATATTSTSDCMASAKIDIHSPLLDGKFFKIIYVSYDGNIKAACTTSANGKRPLFGAIRSTTNFLNHLQVS